MRTISELYEELEDFFLEITEISISQEYKLFADQGENFVLVAESILYTNLTEQDKEKILDYFKDIADIIFKIGNYYIELDELENSDEKDISLEDARFMLVSCSTFINYLTIKSDKARIKSDKKNKIVSLFTP